MNWIVIGRTVRAIRLRLRVRQVDVAARASVGRGAVSLLERGHGDRLAGRAVEAIAGALGARFDGRLAWNGPDLDRLLDAEHAALQAVTKGQLERWGWATRVEVSFNRFGERGRIDLLAMHPPSGTLAVIEIKSSLVDAQALLGAMDVRVRLAPAIARSLCWSVRGRPVPIIVFSEDRTTRRRLAAIETLFDRYNLRGRAAMSWVHHPTPPAPLGLLWFTALPTARVVRISGQRVRGAAPRRSP